MSDEFICKECRVSGSSSNYKDGKNHYVIYYYSNDELKDKRFTVDVIEDEEAAKNFCSKYSTDDIIYRYELLK